MELNDQAILRSAVYWVGSHPLVRGPNKIEVDREYSGKNKGKHFRQVPRCNFYFVALLVFLV